MNTTELLIVEDHDDFRDRLLRLLGAFEEFNCRAASEAKTALALMEERPADVVVMDINLVTHSGIDLTRTIKQRWPDVQVLICTVHEDEDKIFSALQAGATGYLLKRAPLTELITAVKDIAKGGSPMTSGIARKVVASFQATQQHGDELSQRENDVLELLARGYRPKEIGEKLFVSESTVRSHIRGIYEKLQVQSTVEALRKTRRIR
jgi:DNA-binding NarL/FixJ family response regulator